MHELSLATSILDTVVRHAEGRQVTAVSLRVGRLRQVIPESLDFYFGIVTRGTVCEGARLEQTVVPARLRCPLCDRDWEIDVPVFRCPTCGTAAVEVVAGQEFLVESIEVEEGRPCTASA